jgi:hypothetical protein
MGSGSSLLSPNILMKQAYRNHIFGLIPRKPVPGGLRIPAANSPEDLSPHEQSTGALCGETQDLDILVYNSIRFMQ